jgi:DNA-binding CsgD family transcriptional regulator
METLTSILNQQYENLKVYEDLLQNNQLSFEQVGELSGDVLFYTDEDFNLRYLNREGRDWIGLSHGDSNNIERDFNEKFYHPDTIQYELPKVKNFFKNQQLGSIYSNYQQVFNSQIDSYCICLVIFKKFKSVYFGYLTLTIPISKFVGLNRKMQRIISEEMFRDCHRFQFEQLTERESEILKLLAVGRNNPEISDDLFISRHTVEKHRKNINRKLGIHGFKDILDYAYAFDLV